MSADYALALLRTGPRPEWSRLMPFSSDVDAIAAAGRIAKAEARRSSLPASLMVGRSADEGRVDWLGGWDWDTDGTPSWEPTPSPGGLDAGS